MVIVSKARNTGRVKEGTEQIITGSRAVPGPLNGATPHTTLEQAGGGLLPQEQNFLFTKIIFRIQK